MLNFDHDLEIEVSSVYVLRDWLRLSNNWKKKLLSALNTLAGLIPIDNKKKCHPRCYYAAFISLGVTTTVLTYGSLRSETQNQWLAWNTPRSVYYPRYPTIWNRSGVWWRRPRNFQFWESVLFFNNQPLPFLFQWTIVPHHNTNSRRKPKLNTFHNFMNALSIFLNMLLICKVYVQKKRINGLMFSYINLNNSIRIQRRG